MREVERKEMQGMRVACGYLPVAARLPRGEVRQPAAPVA